MKKELVLEGILEEGYGVVPKKLMRYDINYHIKLLMCYLLSYCGGGTVAWPSVSRMSEELGLSRPTVIKYLEEAVQAGLIEKQNFQPGTAKHRHRYILLFLSTTFTPKSKPPLPSKVKEVNPNNISTNNNIKTPKTHEVLCVYYNDKYKEKAGKSVTNWPTMANQFKRLAGIDTEAQIKATIDTFFAYDKRTQFGINNFIGAYDNLAPLAKVKYEKAEKKTKGWKCPFCGFDGNTHTGSQCFSCKKFREDYNG